MRGPGLTHCPFGEPQAQVTVATSAVWSGTWTWAAGMGRPGRPTVRAWTASVLLSRSASTVCGVPRVRMTTAVEELFHGRRAISYSPHQNT